MGTRLRPKASTSAVSRSTLGLFSGRASMYSVKAREFAVVSYAAQQCVQLLMLLVEEYLNTEQNFLPKLLYMTAQV